MPMTRMLTSVCLTLCAALAWGAEPRGKPNIILVLVDDMGWGDLSFCPWVTEFATLPPAPLAAGPHAIDFTIVQGASAPGKIKLEWEGPGTPRQEVPDSAFLSE